MTSPLQQKVKKKPLDESERGEWKSWLKAQHSENEDHGTGPVTLWEIDGKQCKQCQTLVFGGSKITADGDSAMKLKYAYSLEGKLWPT